MTQNPSNRVHIRKLEPKKKVLISLCEPYCWGFGKDFRLVTKATILSTLWRSVRHETYTYQREEQGCYQNSK